MSSFSMQSPDLRAPIWILLMALLSVIFSFAFACATPFAAFAAIAAVTLPRTYAYALISTVFIANQFVGYTFLEYFKEEQSVVWGAAILVAALTATSAALFMNQKLLQLSLAIRTTSSCMASIIAYQAVMLFAAIMLDGMEGNSLPIVMRVTAIDVVAFVLLLTIHKMGKSVDLTPQYNHQ